MYGRILFPVHMSINAKSDLVAALRLLITVEYLFVSLFLHLRLCIETEMCRISVSSSWIATELLDSHIYLPIHLAYAERYAVIVQQVVSQSQCRVGLSIVPIAISLLDTLIVVSIFFDG